jgi:hypothetical protein
MLELGLGLGIQPGPNNLKTIKKNVKNDIDPNSSTNPNPSTIPDPNHPNLDVVEEEANKSAKKSKTGKAASRSA